MKFLVVQLLQTASCECWNDNLTCDNKTFLAKGGNSWIVKLWVAANTQVFLSSVSHQNLNHMLVLLSTVCPTRYRTRHFFNNSNTNEDSTTKIEQEYVQISLQYPH